MPKKMLPIVDKSTIQYIVEKILASRIEEILINSGMPSRPLKIILIFLLNWNPTCINMEAGAAAADPADFFHQHPLHLSAVPEGAGGCHPLRQRVCGRGIFWGDPGG